MSHRYAMVFVGLASVLTPIAHVTANPYVVVDLGTLGGASSAATGINNRGQVVGQASTTAGVDAGRAFLYSNGTMADLGTLSGDQVSIACGINDSGQVVGYSTYLLPVGDGTKTAFIFGDGTMTYIGTPAGDFSSMAYAINASGEVAGAAETAPLTSPTQAFVYNNAAFTMLGSAGGIYAGYGAASGINANGQVVGYIETTARYETAVLYSGGTMTDLGVLPGNQESFATGINSAGEIVGWSENFFSAASRAFVYGNGTMTDLGTFNGGSTYATAVNAAGEIVGYAGQQPPNYDAFVYDNGNFVDLNTVISPASGWVLNRATGINDSGQIVGSGTNPAGKSHAFLLEPASPGDANLDGRVDINDLTIVLSNFGKTAGASWTTGDFVGDGQVDINDLTIVLSHFGQSLGASAVAMAAVPEPSTMAIAAAALLGWLSCAWKRSARVTRP